MAVWTDAHNHLQDSRFGGDPAGLVAAMRDAGVGRCVVNATREGDWDAVGELAARFPGFVMPAFGIHPWHAHTAAAGWEERLRERLDRHPLASVGECGVDQWVSTPPPEVQLTVFAAQVRIARDMNRPLTIHCLKAWGLLFEAFDREPPPARFLMHSFGGSIETARRLVPLGAWFSFSGHFLHPRKQAVIEVFRQLPRERILLETDAPDMAPPPELRTHRLAGDLNHPANLPAIGAGLATALNMPPDELARLTTANAAALFGVASPGGP